MGLIHGDIESMGVEDRILAGRVNNMGPAEQRRAYARSVNDGVKTRLDLEVLEEQIMKPAPRWRERTHER
uniref:Uncharacterized protein n=1 Tax=Candidatus Kentrum eta TaxID=2126337 RepID=A0A450UE09_9GAMM|nr:MAG: hypothetical protein BECKH772A_GA0070896_1001031 [Candidatus Kentron sp. H]VFJ90783.1 MAG: hypothetical protein BECKH772B_GA0070898_1001131 [Candidatus Kentron sp. H]VFJ96921.1 MAG: hypothetical protein BECKH772C_GA0070978_1000931 [Candidatus Kentron sp. H]